jgi:hypothetical protein
MHINEHVSGDDCFPNLNELAYLGYFLRRNSILDSYICEIHESTLLGLAWLGCHDLQSYKLKRDKKFCCKPRTPVRLST